MNEEHGLPPAMTVAAGDGRKQRTVTVKTMQGEVEVPVYGAYDVVEVGAGAPPPQAPGEMPAGPAIRTTQVEGPIDGLTILGHTIRKAVRHLETFPRPLGVEQVSLATEEFTSICPITGQPDFQTVEIVYYPRERCLESKSLKLYLWAFRDEGHFCEALAARIARDVWIATQADEVSVTVKQRPRGGIAIDAYGTWDARKEEVYERTEQPTRDQDSRPSD